jgi:hypothetical protein
MDSSSASNQDKTPIKQKTKYERKGKLFRKFVELEICVALIDFIERSFEGFIKVH